jgi:hypothetical protein
MQSQTACSNEVSVTFRFLGEALNPEAITARMTLSPTAAHARGESVPEHPERKYATGYWGLDSTLAPVCSLDEHLQHLLARLASRREAIKEIEHSGCSMSFYCAYFMQTRTDNAIQLDPQTLGGIAALGARLELHIYCDRDTAE